MHETRQNKHREENDGGETTRHGTINNGTTKESRTGAGGRTKVVFVYEGTLRHNWLGTGTAKVSLLGPSVSKQARGVSGSFEKGGEASHPVTQPTHP